MPYDLSTIAATFAIDTTAVTRKTAQEFFYHDTPARFVDMALALAQSVVDGRTVDVVEHDGLVIAHVGGGTYMVNEMSTGVGDSIKFQSDSLDEAKIDAVYAWRA